MKINQEMRSLEVYYDGGCGMCCRFKEWYVQQALDIEVEFINYNSEAARERFTDLVEYDPEKAMVVRANTGEVFTGAESTVVCLWACSEHRRLAEKLCKPMFLPLAKKAYPLIANNRYKISKLLFNDRVLRRELEGQDSGDCDDNCKL